MLTQSTMPDRREQADAAVAHVTDAAMALLIAQALPAGDEEITVRHLQECGACRSRLRERIERERLEVTHPAFQALTHADEWAQFAASGEEATQVERAFLRAQGVNPVYQRVGVLVEELSDGSTRPIGPSVNGSSQLADGRDRCR